MADFTTFLSNPRRPRWWLIDIVLYDPLAKSETTYYYGSHSYLTEPSHTPANTHWSSRLVQPGIIFERSLFSGDRLAGFSPPSFGDFSLSNGDGELDFIFEDNLRIDGRDITVRLGEPKMPFADWGIYKFKGKEIIESEDGRRVIIKLQGKSQAFSVPLQSERYMGTGQCVDLDRASGDRVTVTHHASLDHAAAITVEALVQLETLPSVSGTRHHVVHKGGLAASGAFNLRVESDDTVRFTLREDITQTAFTASSTSTLAVDRWYRLTGRWDGTDLQTYIDGEADGSAVSFSGTPQTDTSAIELGDNQVSTALDGKIDDVRVWIDQSRTAAQISQNARRELLANDTTGLACYLKLNENTGTATFDETTNANDGTLSASTLWASALEGDSVDTGGSLTGKPKATGFGEVPSVEPIFLDSKNRVYGVHWRAIKAIDSVEEGGLKLAPLLSTTGKCDFNSSKTITATDAQDWRSFARAQTVTASGTASNDGDYTLASQPVLNSSGQWVLNVNEAIINEAGVSATVATKSGAHEYTPDLATGTFALVADPTLPITCAFRGDSEGGYVETAADILERAALDHAGLVAGDIDSTSLTALNTDNSATLGYWQGAVPTTIANLAARLVNTVGASYGFGRIDGKLTVARLEAPTSGGSADVDLDETSLLTITRRGTTPTVSEQDVLYRQNRRALREDEIAGSVKTNEPERLDFLKTAWRTASATQDPDRIVEHPSAEPAPDVESLFTFEADAITEAQRLYDLHLDREIFEMMSKLQLGEIEVGEGEVDVTTSRFASTAATKRFRLVNLRDESGNRIVSTVWG